MGHVNKRYLCFHGSGSCKSKVEVLAGWVSAEGSLPAAFSPHGAKGERESELSGVSSDKDTNCIRAGPHPYDTI